MPQKIVFIFQNLHNLKLYCYWLKPSMTFGGFKNLERIYLNKVTIAQDAFENLMFGWPLLERLVMREV